MAKPKPQPLIRLNKYLSDCGVASRRKADLLIEEGQIKINGKTTYELGVKINPATDTVTYRSRRVTPQEEKIYLMMNKPKHVLTSTSDPLERPTVIDLIDKRKYKHRIYPVGRLDWDSEGMLLLTNDGEFSNAIMSPKSKITKTYLVKLDGKPTDQQLERLMRGISIVGGRVKAQSILRLNKGSSTKDWIQISITEGKNRQVRKMFEKIGFSVVKLQRVQIGQLKMGKLPRGEVVELTPPQMLKIFEKL